ncbi:MAG TPA: response regulator transcription factor [Bryobacteraceae bacterium]|nr:response regulator transcription factor [Bryobacteraceae bacterium]
MIRVLIIADSLERGRALARFLGEDERLEVVGVRTGSVFREDSIVDVADVILSSGLRVAQLPGDGPPVVVLSDDFTETVPAGEAIHGWLPMHSSVGEIAAAITAASSGLFVLTQEQTRRWLPNPGRATGESFEVESLTPRELQVLRLLAEGLGNKELAGQLGISDHTAKFHVAQILAKLGATSRAEAVAIGIRRGLVPI